MADIFVSKVNELYIKVDTSKDILLEMSEYFTFDVPNAHFTPAYKSRWWDGKIRLLNRKTKTIYYGLYNELKNFTKEREYTIQFDNSVNVGRTLITESDSFIESLTLPMEVRDYQKLALDSAITDEKRLIVCPTASGKSLIIYLILRYFNQKSLIVVPTVSLVEQMFGDFEDYSKLNGWNVDEHCHKIYSGKEKLSDKQITISTWQSIYKMPEKFFSEFRCFVGDEAHGFNAKSLVDIMLRLSQCPVKIGTTGTLKDVKTNELVLQGIFGPTNNIITTKELIDRNIISDIEITCLSLNYPKKYEKDVRNMDYHQEVKFITQYPKRNTFLKNLCFSLEGNTLILLNFIDDHLIPFAKLLEENNKKGKDIRVVYGQTPVLEREAIRAEMETKHNIILVASYGTFSQGINIKNIRNIIFASPYKSKIRVLQSIGRGLRKSELKDKLRLYDIADIIGDNFVKEHFQERAKLYMQEGFPTKFYNINLGE